MLIDIRHFTVGNDIGRKFKGGELLADSEQHAVLLQGLAGLLHLEADEDITCVLREAVDILLKRVPSVIGAEIVETEVCDIVERLLGVGAIHIVFSAPVRVLRIGVEHGLARGLQGAFKPSQKREREHDLVILGSLDDVTDIIGDVPYILDVFERSFLLFGHCRCYSIVCAKIGIIFIPTKFCRNILNLILQIEVGRPIQKQKSMCNSLIISNPTTFCNGAPSAAAKPP